MDTSRSPAIHHVEVEGHRLAYRERGSGPPLVLLHGWPLDSREWQRQLDALSDEFRVIAWDAPGAGRSSDPPATFRLADWADCLAAFLQALDLAPAHVGGLSFGGGLALELFRQHPEVVRSLILMSAYAGWGGSLPAEEVHRRVELTRRNTMLPSKQWALAEADLSDTLAEVDVPTLLLYGELDVRSPRSVWERIHGGIADSRLVVIPHVGHMVDMQVAERCNDEIRAFIRQVEHSRPLGRSPDRHGRE